MSHLLDGEEAAQYARDVWGPPMGPDAAELVWEALAFFEKDPRKRGAFCLVGGEQRQYSLLGAALLMAGWDIRILAQYNDAWEIPIELLLGLGFSTFDFYALEELGESAQTVAEARELFSMYEKRPRRVSLARRLGDTSGRRFEEWS